MWPPKSHPQPRKFAPRRRYGANTVEDSYPTSTFTSEPHSPHLHVADPSNEDLDQVLAALSVSGNELTWRVQLLYDLYG
jgi:hypothetical protein